MWKTGKRQRALSCNKTTWGVHKYTSGSMPPERYVRKQSYGPYGLPTPRFINGLGTRRLRCRFTLDLVNPSTGFGFLLSIRPAGVSIAFKLWFCNADIIQTAMAGISSTCPMMWKLSRRLVSTALPNGPGTIRGGHRRNGFGHAPRCNEASIIQRVQCVSDGTVSCFIFLPNRTFNFLIKGLEIKLKIWVDK